MFGQKATNKLTEPITDSLFFNETNKWFSAWELISKDVYNIDNLIPVEFVFFDDKFVYSTSNITIPKGKFIKGPKLLNASFAWKRTLHNDSIILPDKNIVPVGLMSFASELQGKTNKSFFVMPLLSFWKKAGVSSKELGIENLVTGVFIHEFSHSQQMQNFGKKMTEYEKNNHFGIDFSDDIVQNLFDKDSSYTKLYIHELNTFYEASKENNTRIKDSLIKVGIGVLQKRHNKFFTGKYESLKKIDEFFLTMEGLGQFTMYCWLINPKGANLSVRTAVQGVRRNKKRWSQDEGFALFLILEQLSGSKNWSKRMFGNETDSVIKLINQKIK